jgi:LacI family transcriptional regulator, galactose operon repressor
MNRKVTIKDIAKIAKVSTTAVSMALNDRPGVSDKTRRRIIKIAEQHDYQPNFAAKSLISNRSYTIGLIVNNIADPFYPEIAKGIEEKANELGYSLLLCNTNRSLKGEKRSLNTLRAKSVDGVILTTVTVDDPHINPLIEERFPFVLINRLSMDPELENKMDYVVLDNHACGYTAVKHLYRLGHDRIAVITGALNTSTGMMRTRGATRAMKDFGMDLDDDMVVECGYIRENAYEAAHRLLEIKNPPTAFFAQDDHMALGVREAVISKGLKIPEDIALMGVDDIDTASLTGVDLTTISQKKYAMGVMGVEILINKIEKNRSGMVNKIVLEAELIRRRSCGFHLQGYIR